MSRLAEYLVMHRILLMRWWSGVQSVEVGLDGVVANAWHSQQYSVLFTMCKGEETGTAGHYAVTDRLKTCTGLLQLPLVPLSHYQVSLNKTRSRREPCNS